MTEVSSTRLYLGNLPRTATKADVEAHFATHGTGEITEIKLMNGFGFIEYKDAMDARDVVPAFHGSDFMGERLTVQFARGTRHREGGNGGGFNNERAPPRPRRTPHRMQITGLPTDTSWQDLKDFARQSSLDVVYSETGRDGNGRGFVEFETAADLRTAVEKLDGREFKGNRVTCVADLTHFIRPNPICLLATSAARAHVLLADVALTRLRWTTTIGVALHEVTVRAEMDIVTAIVSAALVESTMMIALDTDPLLAALWMITLHREAAMTTPTVETILRHPIPMPMVDPTTVLQETSLLEMGRTLVMGTLASMTVVAVTDPGGAQNMLQYRDRILASSSHWTIRKETM
ncbi:Pre-mRNA-splicing factor srp2 [Colletotrichum fructicola]|nr:Pre-mRNA-splicing factor srp2 [Colletotrichum fructicola]KAF4907273.1 Pre-mRNA-splicing factor srp2 [Colletotrichum fructicola]KAF4935670.1 Pre-mRNA-splicing factor srp2 [Colletotrichum fructicola]